MDNQKLSLFEEHRIRFERESLFPCDIPADLVDVCDYENQATWNLGYIPWHEWRRPFQKAMLEHLITINRGVGEPIYLLVNNTLATVKENFQKPPSDADRLDLFEMIESFASIKISQQAELVINNMFDENTFKPRCWDSFFLKFSENYRHKKKMEYIELGKIQMLCRVLRCFLKECRIACEKEGQEIKDTIVLFSLLAINAVDFKMIDFANRQKILFEEENPSIEVYKFWSWQYTYRNSDYKQYMSYFIPFLEENFHSQNIIRSANCFEYVCLPQNEFVLNPGFSLVAPEIYDAYSVLWEKFGRLPTFPISSYTSDFILKRMLTGQFHYLERETPLGNIKELAKLNICRKNFSQCTLDRRKSIKVVDSHRNTYEKCDPKCITSIKSEEYKSHLAFINREYPRIRKEGINRMVGLWIWDYCDEHKVEYKEAKKALIEKFFSKENPHWNSQKIWELRSKDKIDWYDYCSSMINEASLFNNYQNAKDCIESAKLLAHSRGKSK